MHCRSMFCAKSQHVGLSNQMKKNGHGKSINALAFVYNEDKCNLLYYRAREGVLQILTAYGISQNWLDHMLFMLWEDGN